MSLQTKQFYEFGPFRLYPARHLLVRAGKVVPLTPKAFETLAMLVQNSGRVVEKDELMKEIWPDTFVEEGSLTRNISVLRKTLGEGPSDHQYIQTVPRHGYRFVAGVREAVDEAVDEESESEPYSEEVNNNGGEILPAEPVPVAAEPAPAGSSVGREPRRVRFAIILAALIVAVAGMAYGLSRYMGPGGLARPIQMLKVTRFTYTGKSLDAAISPDGKYVAFSVDDAGQQSLWVKQVVAGSSLQIVPPADVSYQGLAFSPDGNYVYYNLWDRKHVGVIYKVPVLGGTPVRAIVDVMPCMSLSPDGKRIAFVRGYAAQKEGALIVANVDGTEERKLTIRKNSTGWFSRPAWSPDGKVVAFTAGGVGSQGLSYMQLLAVPAEGGEERPLCSQKWFGMGGIAWLGDGSGLLIAATEQTQSPLQLWSVSYPGGVAKKISNDPTGYGGLSVTADSSALVTIQEDQISNIWVVPDGDTNKSRKITSSKYEGYGLSWTPDGRIVYVSFESGNADLWIVDQNGGNRRQLTTDPAADFCPSVTADGRYILFISIRKGIPHIWRMDIDGSNPKQLTDGIGEWAPNCSPKDQTFIYLSASDGKTNIWRMNIDGGKAVRLTSKYSYLPSISPDGKWIVYSYWDDEAKPERLRREVIPIDGSQKGRQFDIPTTAVRWNAEILFQWTPDSQAITYIDNRGGACNIWRLPLDGGEPKQLTDFKDEKIFWFGWSPDGKNLAITRGIETSDVVLIKD